MKPFSPWTACLTLALLAGCPKKHDAVEPAPAPVDPGTSAGKIAAPTIHDPEARCHDPEQGGHTVFMVELGYPEACAVIPSEPGGEIHSLEITIEESPSKALIMEPVDLGTRAVAYAAEGCGLRVTFTGAIGTLDLDVAVALKTDDLVGTAHWTPADGGGCDLEITGSYSDYSDD